MNEQMISHQGPGHLWLASLSSRGVRYGLERVRVALEAMGQPQTAFPTVLVAGTNGKGSVASMLAAMLMEAGLNVGQFTSPHLVETRERVRLGDRCVSAERLDEALCAVREACAGIQVAPDEVAITPFEALTCAAFEIYRDAAVDVAVLECGLGGRLDATNTADPVVSVLTRVGYDHTRTLGATLAAIATEKVHIARADRPLIVAQPSIVVGAARRAGLTPVFRKLAFDLTAHDVTGDGLERPTSGVLRGPMLDEALHVEVALPGAHQIENAALAVMAFVEFDRWRQSQGLPGLPHIAEVAPALTAVVWPCRAEWISQTPPVVLDGAHNEDGMKALTALLGARSKRWQVVLAVRDNRNPEPLLRALAPITECLWLPRMEATNLHRPEALAAVAETAARGPNLAVGSREVCLRGALTECGRGAGVVLTGSLYGLGEWLGSGMVQSPRLRRWLDGL